jgi:bacterioferritin
LKVGKNVKEQLANDLELELGAVQLYNRAVKLARDESDNATAEFFQVILKDEEEHVDWLEAQAHLIQDLGYERYLTQQLKKD